MSRILFLGSYPDKPYIRYLKGCVGSATVPVSFGTVKTKMEFVMFCKKHKITEVLSTQIALLEKLLGWTERKKPSLADYAGSMFHLEGIDIVFIPPIKQIVTVPYGKFLTRRLVEKFTKKSQWLEPTEFSWELCTPANVPTHLAEFANADLICVDIETLKEDAQIRCVSYTAFYLIPNLNDVHSKTIVLPMSDMWAVHMMRKFNDLPAAKILQNGKYDIAYMSRYGAPLHNYRWDTAALFHAWLSELPKDLGFLNAFLIRDATYWKDLAKTDDLMEYYRYNALDTWGTGNAFLSMMLEYPDYAMTNYSLEFPQQFPCHLAEMTGIKRDMGRLEAARKEQQARIDKNTRALNKMLGLENFNTNSPKQVKELLHILGCKDLKSADEKNLEKARYRHPLNERILGLIIDNRKARKLTSTYLTTGETAKEFNGRILYALNPHSTDTGRLASKEHHFWCGYNVQNQPRGPEVKQTYVADDGFFFAEVDLSQAETWDTAYISGDKNLIEAVNSPQDFHSGNVERFFGIPYADIYDDETGKTLNKEARDLGKRVNHGANYNMGPYVLVETMGLKNIFKARKLLGLPVYYTALQVADHLLEAFHAAYPEIRGTYHAGIVAEVKQTGYLASRAIHYSYLVSPDFDQYLAAAGAWTRRCFGDPDKSKHVLNSYIAHGPQSLNAMTLNKAWLRCFTDIAIHPEHRDNIKYCAQVHDSILFQYRAGADYICEMVRERMEIPVTIKGYDDVVRTFTVPADIKAGKDGTPVKYWSETE